MGNKILGWLQIISGVALLALQVYLIFAGDYESTTDLLELMITGLIGIVFVTMGASGIKEA
ncbi:hypothetical protein J4204_00300 [Candidatus Woesearchaeota archaeon]|nr:hypothetical protein [Candidatus Woesearchaeota archaeon]